MKYYINLQASLVVKEDSERTAISPMFVSDVDAEDTVIHATTPPVLLPYSSPAPLSPTMFLPLRLLLLTCSCDIAMRKGSGGSDQDHLLAFTFETLGEGNQNSLHMCNLTSVEVETPMLLDGDLDGDRSPLWPTPTSLRLRHRVLGRDFRGPFWGKPFWESHRANRVIQLLRVSTGRLLSPLCHPDCRGATQPFATLCEARVTRGLWLPQATAA